MARQANTSFELLEQIDKARAEVARRERELEEIEKKRRETNYGCGSCDSAYAMKYLADAREKLADLERQLAERSAA